MKTSKSDVKRHHNQKDATPFPTPSARRFSYGRLTSAAPSPSGQTLVDEKEGQRRCQRKSNKNTAIHQILPSVNPNLGSATRNGDRGETTDVRQRETKRKSRNTIIWRNLPLVCDHQLFLLLLYHCQKCKQQRSFYGLIKPKIPTQE